jgi:hypothetical protein
VRTADELQRLEALEAKHGREKVRSFVERVE